MILYIWYSYYMISYIQRRSLDVLTHIGRTSFRQYQAGRCYRAPNSTGSSISMEPSGLWLHLLQSCFDIWYGSCSHCSDVPVYFLLLIAMLLFLFFLLLSDSLTVFFVLTLLFLWNEEPGVLLQHFVGKKERFDAKTTIMLLYPEFWARAGLGGHSFSVNGRAPLRNNFHHWRAVSFLFELCPRLYEACFLNRGIPSILSYHLNHTPLFEFPSYLLDNGESASAEQWVSKPPFSSCVPAFVWGKLTPKLVPRDGFPRVLYTSTFYIDYLAWWYVWYAIYKYYNDVDNYIISPFFSATALQTANQAGSLLVPPSNQSVNESTRLVLCSKYCIADRGQRASLPTLEKSRCFVAVSMFFRPTQLNPAPNACVSPFICKRPFVGSLAKYRCFGMFDWSTHRNTRLAENTHILTLPCLASWCHPDLSTTEVSRRFFDQHTHPQYFQPIYGFVCAGSVTLSSLFYCSYTCTAEHTFVTASRELRRIIVVLAAGCCSFPPTALLLALWHRAIETEDTKTPNRQRNRC